MSPPRLRTRCGSRSAIFLGSKSACIRVVAPDVGGGFGPKARLYPEEIVLTALALELDYPVRWIEQRSEHLLASAHARDHHYRVTAYANRHGHILGIDCEIIVDAGAYGMWPQGPYQEANMVARCLPGPYAVPHYRARTYTVATNKTPIGPYRGVGRPGACFVMERTSTKSLARSAAIQFWCASRTWFSRSKCPTRRSRVCATIPVIIRTAYADVPNCCSSQNARKRERRACSTDDLSELVSPCFNEQTAHGATEYAGRGAAVVPGFESCTARILTDGSVVLTVGIQSHGQGLETALAQIVCEELGIDPARISYAMATPRARPSVSARSPRVAWSCRAEPWRARVVFYADKLCRIGAHLLQCDVAEVRCEGGRYMGPMVR